jgi:hypothetical protein
MTSWARLVDQSGNSQPLVEDEVIIGRAKGTHCVVLYLLSCKLYLQIFVQTVPSLSLLTDWFQLDIARSTKIKTGKSGWQTTGIYIT